MKKLLIPVIIAVLAGVGGGSGFSYMRASKAYLADSLQRVDSLKAHPPAAHDSSATADSSHAAGDAHGADSVSLEEHLPMTPADSIRALSAARESLRSATSGVPDAKDHDATDHKAAPAKGATDASHAPDATHKNDGKSDSKSDSKSESKSGTAAVAEIVRAARNEAMTTTLPEQRLAKIFAAMSAKDAAKVMEQMPDGDVRSILSLMNDRSAAALLAQFTPARAAAITKGAIRANGEKP
jgi:hypothetical protein